MKKDTIGFIAILIIWCIIGNIGIITWWTKKLDYTLGNAILLVPTSCVLGPLAWGFHVLDFFMENDTILFKEK